MDNRVIAFAFLSSVQTFVQNISTKGHPCRFRATLLRAAWLHIRYRSVVEIACVIPCALNARLALMDSTGVAFSQGDYEIVDRIEDATRGV